MVSSDRAWLLLRPCYELISKPCLLQPCCVFYHNCASLWRREGCLLFAPGTFFIPCNRKRLIWIFSSSFISFYLYSLLFMNIYTLKGRASLKKIHEQGLSCMNKSIGWALFSFLLLCIPKGFLNPVAKQKEGCEDLVPSHTAKGQKLNKFQITQWKV